VAAEPIRSVIREGMRVRVVRGIRVRDAVWPVVVEGAILAQRDEPTGSWYAHGRDHRYWLRRLWLRKDDGEITSIVLDEASLVTPLARQGPCPAAEPAEPDS